MKDRQTDNVERKTDRQTFVALQSDYSEDSCISQYGCSAFNSIAAATPFQYIM